MEIGYCPRCQQNVTLVRKEFNVCLMLILLLTTGVGAFIYLIIWLARPKNRCIICQSPTYPPKTVAQPSYQIQASNTQDSSINQRVPQNREEIYSKPITAPSTPQNSSKSTSAHSASMDQTYMAPSPYHTIPSSSQNITIGATSPDLTTSPFQEKSEKSYCPYCGNEVRNDARFCQFCGQQLQRE